MLLMVAAVTFGAVSAVAQCTSWLNPSPTTGWTDFTSTFGGAPCTANPPTTNEITAFEVFAAEAYQMANIIAGGQYTFSTCNGPGAGTWPIRFTIITPTGTVDAFGINPGSTCAITWTATQSGIYLIVVNQSGQSNCGGGPNTAVNNGFPAITYLGGATCPTPPTCEAGNFVGDAVQNICGPTGTATVSSTGVTFPVNGRAGVLFRAGVDGTGALGGDFVLTFATSPFPYTFDSNLNGVLSANAFPPFAGTWTAKVVALTSTTFASICDSTATGATLNFLPVNAPGCVAITECEAGTIDAPATQVLCPNQLGSVSATGQIIPNSPTAGAQGVLFRPGVDGTGGLEDAFILTGVTYPYTFDSDLNGVLSANLFPPLVGDWILRPAVAADVANPFASICDTTFVGTVVTFLTNADPGCEPAENDSPCTPTAIACGQLLNSTNGTATQSLAPIACDGFTAPGAIDVWFSFTSDGVFANSFTTSGFDAVLSIYSASECNTPGTALACSDDEFEAEETLDAGVLPAGNYLLRVYSYDPNAAGAFSVLRNCVCPLGAPGTPCNDGDPNTENDQINFNCQCAGTPIGGCTVDGGTVATTSPRQNLCKGDGEPNIVQLTVSGNSGLGRFGLVTSPALDVVAINTTGTFNMETFPAGNYFVGHISVNAIGDLAGVTNVNQLSGCFDLSNQLSVSSFAINGGVITANGPTTLCPGSLSFSVTGQQGPNFRWAVLNQTSTTVLLNNTTGNFNFTTLGPGIYRVVHAAYGPGVNIGAIDPQNPQGCIDPSNLITVTIQSCPAQILTAGNTKPVFAAKSLSEKLDPATKGQSKAASASATKIGSFDVFPNPSTGSVNAVYNAKADGNVQVRVFDVIGKLVVSQNMAVNTGTNFMNINLSDLEAGMYVMSISEGTKVSTQRVVISK